MWRNLMQSKSMVQNVLLLGFLVGLISPPLSAVEVVMEEDFIQGVITEEQLVRVAENAIFLLDTSSSMNEEFRDTGRTKLDLVSSEFKKRNSFFPEIGHKFGIFGYTPWQEISAVQPFNREQVAAALETLPVEGSGPTRLAKGLGKVEDVIKSLSGRTAVFVFFDGHYNEEIGSPGKVAKRLVRDYDVCFYVISTAKAEKNDAIAKDVASLNSCSRLIPLEYYLDRPEYTSGALFDVRATEQVITIAQTKIVGLDVDQIKFAFDKTELSTNDKSELDELGQFMTAKPESFAVIAGYTDNVGPEDYNEGLSRRRTEMVARYLTDAHGIDETRLVLQWYGSDNPVVTNDSRDGRATNRRVEIAVGGL
jgi:OOP family OmpA-OmpF porin